MTQADDRNAPRRHGGLVRDLRGLYKRDELRRFLDILVRFGGENGGDASPGYGKSRFHERPRKISISAWYELSEEYTHRLAGHNPVHRCLCEASGAPGFPG